MSNNTDFIDKNKSKIIIVIICALLGVGLMIYGSFNSNEAKEEDDTSSKVLDEELDAALYAENLEKRIAELCENVKGAGSVHVPVTLSGGYTAVYAQNSQSSSSGYKNEFVLSGSGSNEKPLLVGYSVPNIGGVGIVCKGGGNAGVRQEIISLVSATVGISSNKIYVSEG